MAGDDMTPDGNAAEERLNAMSHSEQHYFNSYNHHGIHEEMLVRANGYFSCSTYGQQPTPPSTAMVRRDHVDSGVPSSNSAAER